MTVNGNLMITGNTTSIDSTNTTIWDNIITLNGGTSPSTIPTLNAGIEVDRGTKANTSMIWNETVTAWQITNNGSTYGNIVTNPLQGNLDISSYQIYSSTSAVVVFNDNIAIATTSVAPASLTGNTVVYAQASNSGGSGLYVNNDVYANQELVSKTRSIAYSIIFGS